MENIEKCECIIGMRNAYEDTDLITLAELKNRMNWLIIATNENQPI